MNSFGKVSHLIRRATIDGPRSSAAITLLCDHRQAAAAAIPSLAGAPSRRARLLAAMLLGQLPPPTPVASRCAQLHRLAGDRSQRVRAESLVSLAHQKCSGTGSLVTAAFESPAAGLRSAAVNAASLLWTDSPAMVRVIRLGLRDPSPSVRNWAIFHVANSALPLIAHDQPVILALTRSRAPTTRASALLALARLDPTAAASQLSRFRRAHFHDDAARECVEEATALIQQYMLTAGLTA